jgi:uncharacterized protein (TIRG00374 family)
MKQRLIPKIIRLTLTLILLGWVVGRVGFTQILDTIQDADVSFILLSMLIYQCGVALRSARWWMLLRGASIDVGYRYVLGLVYSSEFFMGTLPTNYAGDLVRIIEFKSGASKVVTAGTVVLDRVLGLIGLLAVALTAMAFRYRSLPPETALGITLIALSILATAILILQGSIVNRLINTLPVLLAKLRDNWLKPFAHVITEMEIRRLSFAVALSALNTLLTVLNHFMVATAVGIQVGIGIFFIFSPTVNLSLILPTLSGLGVREIGYQFLLEPFGVSANIAVALGIGVYLSRLSASLIGGLHYALSNLKR